MERSREMVLTSVPPRGQHTDEWKWNRVTQHVQSHLKVGAELRALVTANTTTSSIRLKPHTHTSLLLSEMGESTFFFFLVVSLFCNETKTHSHSHHPHLMLKTCDCRPERERSRKNKNKIKERPKTQMIFSIHQVCIVFIVKANGK